MVWFVPANGVDQSEEVISLMLRALRKNVIGLAQ
jgi:hypothetical protein